MPPEKIAVIGGGFMGILSVACLKAEGLEPVCFEKTDNYGGTWCYREESQIGVASIMPTTIINHSKEMGAISNFPPPKEFPNFMKHSDLYQYITMYFNHHECGKHITYNTEITSVKRANDYAQTGRWSVTRIDLTTQEVITEIFDAVLVCIGHLNRPSMPTFPGQECFKGKIIHTHSLKEVEEFQDKNVVVVGIGCSALDAAVETSRVSKQVYLSSRCGAHIFSRVGPDGYPFDTTFSRRYLTFLLETLPTWSASWFLETFYIDKVFDHRLMHVPPKCHVLSKEPVINDQIGYKLLSGSVKQKTIIHHFTENGVVFDGEDSVTEADVIIMATGYTWAFPFIEEGVIVKEAGRINLYQCMYPSQLPHATLAIMGFINPFGPSFPLGELQARWAGYMLAHDIRLPSEDAMMTEIIKRHKINMKRYNPGERVSICVDYAEYMDGIAEELRVKPKLLKYLFTDLPLFLRLLFGPILSYQYRLEGHGKWGGAREAIMTSHERVTYPLRKKKNYKKWFLRYIIRYVLDLLPLNINIWHY